MVKGKNEVPRLNGTLSSGLWWIMVDFAGLNCFKNLLKTD